MRSEFRNVIATEDRAALEWTTEGTSNGNAVSYSGVSILEIEGGKVCRFMAYFNPRSLTPHKSWTDGAKVAARPDGSPDRGPSELLSGAYSPTRRDVRGFGRLRAGS
jgi:hypothetical protein